MEHKIVALEGTIERHERLIYEMGQKLDGIHAGLVRIEAVLETRAIPGESAFCVQHMKVIEDVKKDVSAIKAELDQVKTFQWKLSGIASVLLLLLTLFGPSIRALFHFSQSTHQTTMIGGTP